MDFMTDFLDCLIQVVIDATLAEPKLCLFAAFVVGHLVTRATDSKQTETSSSY